MSPPPAGWRPPRIVEPTPPRQLPAQDHARIDEEEARARALTRGIAIVTAIIIMIILFAICVSA
jgi:hypothetical protein